MEKSLISMKSSIKNYQALLQWVCQRADNGTISALGFCQLRPQSCRAAYFHSAVKFGFVSGESGGYYSKCNFNKQVDATGTSKCGFQDRICMLQINLCFFRTHLLDGDGQCPVSWCLCFPKHIHSCQQGKSDSA